MTATADDFLSGFEGFQFERVTLTDAVAYIAAVNLRLGKTDCLNPWKAANELVRAIQCGALAAYSQCGVTSTRVPINAFAHVDPYPADDDRRVTFGNERSLRWRDGRSPYGEGDAIVGGTKTLWRRITIERERVVRLWSLDTNEATGARSAASTAVGDNTSIRRKLTEAGKRSGEVRRQNRRWTSHAADLVKAIIAESPAFGRPRIATEVSNRWKKDLEILPGPDTLVDFVKELEDTGVIPTQKERTKKRGNEQVQQG